MQAYDHLDKGPTELPTMYQVCGLKDSDKTIEEAHAEGIIIGNLMIDTLAFAFGHEIGHVWYSDPWSQLHSKCNLAPRMPQRQRVEVCADDFARRLSQRAGFSPYSILGTAIPMFAAVEGPKGAHGEGSHPAAMCRSLILARAIQDGAALLTPTPHDTDEIRKLRKTIKAQVAILIATTTTPIGPDGHTLCRTPID
jgi:hypothetical protein